VNHCALTARVAAAAGLTVRAIVLSQASADPDPSAATNADTVRELTGLPVAAIPHFPSPEAAASALPVDFLA
jgi:dethiobiotin synthetase